MPSPVAVRDNKRTCYRCLRRQPHASVVRVTGVCTQKRCGSHSMRDRLIRSFYWGSAVWPRVAAANYGPPRGPIGDTDVRGRCLAVPRRRTNSFHLRWDIPQECIGSGGRLLQLVPTASCGFLFVGRHIIRRLPRCQISLRRILPPVTCHQSHTESTAQSRASLAKVPSSFLVRNAGPQHPLALSRAEKCPNI